ncbi:MAG: translation elongation factor Ts [Planctomycetota bacterium]|nr:translation elongation factor Ts [Planctomycetota bacterium]
MAEITAKMVKALRDETGQGMMDCKKALAETGGDVEAAVELLRKKGMAAAETKAARTAAEGLVAIRQANGSAAMVEVVCETDFCARNDEFRAMVGNVAALAVGAEGDGEIQATDEITAAVQDCFNKIGENMRYVRGVKVSAPKVGSYTHHNGKVGVLVGIDGEIDSQTLSDLCMHIAFANPMGLTKDDVPADLVEKEKRIATEQAIESGKPKEIAEKMVGGKINKFLAANSLLEQPFVRDEKKKVKDILGAAKITTFARFQVGQ